MDGAAYPSLTRSSCMESYFSALFNEVLSKTYGDFYSYFISTLVRSTSSLLTPVWAIASLGSELLAGSLVVTRLSFPLCCNSP